MAARRFHTVRNPGRRRRANREYVFTPKGLAYIAAEGRRWPCGDCGAEIGQDCPPDNGRGGLPCHARTAIALSAAIAEAEGEDA